MTIPLLTTKLYIPSVRPNLVSRPRLIERLNAGLGRNQNFARRLTPMHSIGLISAPAGFGKTMAFIVHPSSSLACPRAPAWDPAPAAPIVRPVKLRGPKVAPPRAHCCSHTIDHLVRLTLVGVREAERRALGERVTVGTRNSVGTCADAILKL